MLGSLVRRGPGVRSRWCAADRTGVGVQLGPEAWTWAVPEKPPLLVITSEQFNEMLRDARPPTADDVSITSDGERLDSKEKVLAFCQRLAAERAQAG